MTVTINKSFFSAYRKGREAARDNGKCPYVDKRGSYNNMVTFSAAFIRFWEEGFYDAQNGLPERYLSK